VHLSLHLRFIAADNSVAAFDVCSIQRHKSDVAGACGHGFQRKRFKCMASKCCSLVNWAQAIKPKQPAHVLLEVQLFSAMISCLPKALLLCRFMPGTTATDHLCTNRCCPTHLAGACHAQVDQVQCQLCLGQCSLHHHGAHHLSLKQELILQKWQ
jgi:hypothetical protein